MKLEITITASTLKQAKLLLIEAFDTLDTTTELYVAIYHDEENQVKVVGSDNGAESSDLH